MGYFLSANINAYKAVDYTTLSGVKLLVYHEGENFSIMTLYSNENGWAFEDLDRAHWDQTEPKRVKVYFEKAGYVSGCAKLVKEDSFTDGQNVKHFSFSVDVMLVEADPEVLPPPIEEPPPPPIEPPPILPPVVIV